MIGGGSRGKEILRPAIKCPNVEAAAVADIYTRRHDEVKSIVPGIATFKDYRALLDDKTIDAVLIATPQHLHAIHFVAAIGAGKDVYQEKTMAFNPGHARRMREALNASSGAVVQVGMQMNSGHGIQKVREVMESGAMGTVTLIQSHHFRNRPYGGWMRQIPADCNPEHVDWAAFQGEARAVPFDPQRYINWRFYWDYSGGDVFENMVHTLAFWFGALDLPIPHSVTMTGANYLSPKMDIPDTFQVSMSHGEKLFSTFTSSFGNSFYGEKHDYLFGTKATLIHTDSDDVHVLPQGKKLAPPAQPRWRSKIDRFTHAKLLRLRPQPQGTGLPARARLPDLDRLPDGGCVISAAEYRALGPGDGGDYLNFQSRFGLTVTQFAYNL